MLIMWPNFCVGGDLFTNLVISESLLSLISKAHITIGFNNKMGKTGLEWITQKNTFGRIGIVNILGTNDRDNKLLSFE